MLRISKISFPGLGIGEFSVDSVAFTLFGSIDIAWYAVIITLGMIAAVTYVVLTSKKIGITFDDVIDFALFTIPIGVIGARLYYVLSEIENYKTFVDVINIREGGLAIYGGIIAGGLTVLTVCYFKKINFLAFADCVSPGVLLAQGIGRWGNFMNGEAFGYETDIFCRMGLNNVLTGFKYMEVHPTFLYESLWNLLGVLLVHLYGKYLHKKYDGQLFLMIFGWYGLGRTFIELLRTDSLYIPGTEIRTSSLLAALIFITCATLLIVFAFKKPNKPLYCKAPKENSSDAKKSEANVSKAVSFKESVAAFFGKTFKKDEKDFSKQDTKTNEKEEKEDK